YVVSFNMFPTTGSGASYVQLVSISTSNLNSSFRVDRKKAEDFTMAPAVMYGAAPGSPMWLVEENGLGNGQAIRVVQMTNILSNAPTFTDTVVPVNPYTNPAASGTWLVQDPGGADINADDTRIFGSVWDNGILVAAHNEGLATTSNDSNAAWYELSTAGNTPTLTDQGVITPGPGVSTYYPEITVEPNGTIGMTYSESSSSEPMSMYVTGRNTSDAPGTMEPPILAIAGQGPYAQPGFGPNSWRAGDHSGIGIDFTDGSFWASAEYDYAAGRDATWGTFIQQFSIASASGGGTNTINGVNVDVHANGLPDYDWYRWTAGGTGTVKVVMQEIGDLEVHLYTLNSLGTMVQLGVASSTKGQGTLTVKGQVAEGAPILVEVKGVNIAPGVHAVGSYSLSIGLT
ncbi:MAG TPA: hypothetical protein VFA18_04215, partial [Gemmataceae bacterium]|nr:hypothetical protein [Gemmataceae bacterium]